MTDNHRRTKPRRIFRKFANDPNPPYGEDVPVQPLVKVGHIDIVTSEAADRSQRDVHYPVIDIDHPVWVVPSNGPHKYALYIDHPVSAEGLFEILDVLAKWGIVEVGYADASRSRGYSAVRPPWVDKPVKDFAPKPVPTTDPWAEPATHPRF